MSYEEYSRRPYRAKCACGKGFLRYYEIYLSNDWGQEDTRTTEIEFLCDNCSKSFHSEYHRYDWYLVPNGMSFPQQPKQLEQKYIYTKDERFVQSYNKKLIKEIIADMTAPKHTYIKNLTNSEAIKFANQWYEQYGKKSLRPMVTYLDRILHEYDDIITEYNRKTPYVENHHTICQKFEETCRQVESNSIWLEFKDDSAQSNLERRSFEEKHKFDDFQAMVSYDPTYQRDLTNHYWDSYHIIECVDSQYLVLDKPPYGTAHITITKKYRCICTLCQKEAIVLSSDFKISDDNDGYYLEASCDCHYISSFEVKTMDILNRLGISYMREKTFPDLYGDNEKLRFDFALYQSFCDHGEPDINLMIELQGPHHYKSGFYDEYGDFSEDTFSPYALKRFEQQQRYDNKKREYCLKHNIALEYIKYTQGNSYTQLEQKLIAILKKYGYSS